MLRIAKQRAMASGFAHVQFAQGGAEALPAEDSSFDVVLASLSLMYVLDRDAAAQEIARVLRPDGRFVAAAWACAEDCDIVKFQQSAGGFAPTSPVPGVGPAALAEPEVFLTQLSQAGLEVEVDQKES